MFKDSIKIRLRAGNGGNGVVKFSKGLPQRPQGGNGGNGGDLYLEASTDLYDLSYLDPNELIAAYDGEDGREKTQNGKDGENLFFKVPIDTHIYLKDIEIGKLENNGERVLIQRGGRGGLGNYHFRAGQDQTFRKFTKGKRVETLNVTLEIKLSADIVLIGLPNAGKSSLINVLTNAKAKVGNFPFTTIKPKLGRMGNITLMDLPGLIEGTAEGKGLGTGFVKHTQKAKIVAHLLSLDSESIFQDYEIIRSELKEMDISLAAKEEIIVLTKTDLVSDDTLINITGKFESKGKKVLHVSVYRPQEVKIIGEQFTKMLK